MERRAGDVRDRCLELRILDGERVALDEHDLFDRPQTGAVERHLGVVGLAGELIDVGDLRRADHVVPTMKTTTTKASQPQIAFLRCRLLQWAMRAATLTVCFDGVIDMSSSSLRAFVLTRSRSTHHTGRVLEPEHSPAVL